MSKSQNVTIGTSPMFVLFVVFLVLKLTNTIAWSWWWITAPLWGPTVLVILLFLVIWLLSVVLG